MSLSRLVAVVAFVCPCLVVGCQNGPKVVPAEGTVLFQGKPVADATVTFSPVAKPAEGTVPNGLATTDGQGRFKLRTYVTSTDVREGVLPGEYRVFISKFVPPTGMSEAEWNKRAEEADSSRPKPGPSPPPKVELLPPQYSSAQNTKLTVTIPPEGKKDLQFDLK